MTHRAVNLMDVLAPPENNWLKELIRRKSDLPAGVHVVRFSDCDDEADDNESTESPAAQQRKRMAA